eukprot:scaffold163310_cov25-Cyclotella_meneghiniana.AAC.1
MEVGATDADGSIKFGLMGDQGAHDIVAVAWESATIAITVNRRFFLCSIVYWERDYAAALRFAMVRSDESLHNIDAIMMLFLLAVRLPAVVLA